MVDLHYFASSLPMLVWGERPALTHAVFLSRCRELLNPAIVLQLEMCVLLPGGPGTDAVLRAWFEFETFLRNTTALMRQSKLKRGGERFVPHDTRFFSVMTEHRLQEVMQMNSPVERETQLDRVRWDFLEGLCVGHRADIEGLELYALKLLLLERIQSRRPEAGKARFSEMVDDGLAQAAGKRSEEN